MNTPLSRRSILSRSLAAAGAATAAGATLATGPLRGEDAAAAAPASDSVNAKSGRLNQSVCQWCYGGLSLSARLFSVNLGRKR